MTTTDAAAQPMDTAADAQADTTTVTATPVADASMLPTFLTPITDHTGWTTPTTPSSPTLSRAWSQKPRTTAHPYAHVHPARRLAVTSKARGRSPRPPSGTTRHEIIRHVHHHELSHLGPARTTELINRSFYFPNALNIITRQLGRCATCAMVKPSRVTHGLLAEEPFQHIA
jgi:hypothetical protein